ncbi:hypothetical protein CEE36_08985 [candidate division TA06 bacterium B3_TA06]|uniref:DUF4468 domain-containing protein n=1 Tax=candidate division TA06 bacterium B3_TA06 TaxID=2012487 RepID=A0A532V1G7_UNCT6|nr:MAG: hypothetical protein CEE36_08985 [candidate division TA06 bacterium B3_TA06]
MKRWIAYCIAPLLGIAGAIGVIIMMSACATTANILPPEERIIQETIEVEGKSKDEIYRDARIWMVRTFTESKAVIEYEDKEAGTIAGKGYVKATGKSFKIAAFAYNVLAEARATPYIRLTITIEAKDNRARITVDQLRMAMKGWGGLGEESSIETVELFEEAKIDIQPLIQDFRDYVTTVREEEW